MWSWKQVTYAHAQIHTPRTSASYHYPSLHPPFGISRPDRSRPITLSHCRPADLSLYHPLPYFPPYLSFSHHFSSLPASAPTHNSLSCLQTVSISKLLKSATYSILLCFLSIALSKVGFFFHVLLTKSPHLTLPNLQPTPLKVPDAPHFPYSYLWLLPL